MNIKQIYSHQTRSSISGMHAPPRGAGKRSARPTPAKRRLCPAPPCENYQNLRGAAGQSWFQSVEIRKAITRKDPILSDKYLPHSQISWFGHFLAPPRPVNFGVSQMLTIDDGGGRGVQEPLVLADVICEQPLSGLKKKCFLGQSIQTNFASLLW